MRSFETKASHLARELATQPENWRALRQVAEHHRALLPAPGERVALIGCGSSLHAARAIAEDRERRGSGLTDATAAGDPLLDRHYDRVIAISRSGTTTEVLRALDSLTGRIPVTVICAVPGSPLTTRGGAILLDDLDEQSVVQSRLVTAVIALFRWHQGDDLTAAAEDADAVLAAPDTDLAAARAADQLTFLGQGAAFGLAEECALKLRESTRSWAESYRMTEYRHGPICIAEPGRVVWALGPLIPGLADDIAATGATLIHRDRDPLADLVAVQRLCLLRAADRGLDPDRPRNLTRSIVLDA